MTIEKIKEILKNLENQRQRKIFAIIRNFEKYGGKAENCTINFWSKNPNYPEIYKLELQIDRYKNLLKNPLKSL